MILTKGVVNIRSLLCSESAGAVSVVINRSRQTGKMPYHPPVDKKSGSTSVTSFNLLLKLPMNCLVQRTSSLEWEPLYGSLAAVLRLSRHDVTDTRRL